MRKYLFISISLLIFSLIFGFSRGIELNKSLGNYLSKLEPIRESIAFESDEIEWIKNHPIVTVAVNHGWMPISFQTESGEFKGMSVDYLNRISHLSNIKLKLKSYDGNPLNETADIISSISSKKLLEGSDFKLVDPPIFSVPYSLFTRKDHKAITSLDDLNGKRVAVFKNNPLYNQISQKYPNIHLVQVDIAEEALNALEDKNIDAYLGNQLVINNVIYLQGYSNIQESLETEFYSDIHLAIKSSHPELEKIISKCIKAIEPNRIEIFKKWDIQEKINYRLNLLIGLVGICAFFVMAVIYLRLRKKHESHTKLLGIDFLTKLPNRQSFQERLKNEVDNSLKNKSIGALLFIDLDKFKYVNDTYGHEAGDILLSEVSNRITNSVRSCDLVSRLGGDEFTVIINSLENIEVVERIANSICSKLSEPFRINTINLNIACSIGIAVFPSDSTSVDELLNFADTAMYESKCLGGNKYQFFQKNMFDEAKSREKLFEELKQALISNQIQVFYQPIVNLEKGSVNMAEALIRWIHPDLGIINPDVFIAVAEEFGIINQIGQIVFENVIKEVKYLREFYSSEFQIFINVSLSQLENSSLFANWMSQISSFGLPGDAISLDVVEKILILPSDKVSKTLKDFKSIGTKISLDDFGTGYSSLNHLKNYDIDFIKIDKSYISNIPENSQESALCEAIIMVAHRFGFKVIAEGVETTEQSNLLTEANCDLAQGFLYSPALPSEEFHQWLSTHIYKIQKNKIKIGN